MRGLRAAWPEQVAGVRPEDFVFLDESGVNRAMSRLYARSPRGTRAFGSAPRNWGGERLHPRRVEFARPPGAHGHQRGHRRGRLFDLPQAGAHIPQLWAGAVVVLDNLGAHKVKGVRELIEGVGARLLYLPPYSPDLNPIEMAWSKLKAHLRAVAARSSATLDAAIGQGLRAVSAQDARGFFKHCGYSSSLNRAAL